MGQSLQVAERSPWDLRGYQNVAIRHTLARDYAMLWLDVGLGKTVVNLSAIMDRIDRLLAFGTLVVAPKLVCSMVWRQEAQQWAHTKGLRLQFVDGNAKQRHYALRKPADIHLVNYENVPWLVDEIIAIWLSRGLYPPWQTIVFDEIDKMKDSTSVRSKAMQRIVPYFPYRVGNTGTPGDEGYTDLFGQYLLIDGGARLGTNYTQYLEKYFVKAGYKHKLRQGAKEEIHALIQDITIDMSQEEFLPELGKPIINPIYVDLPPAARLKYDQLEREMFFELDSGVEIEVLSEAALINKCLQAANGQPYVVPNSGEWAPMHDAKLDALSSIVSESNGQPLLVAYAFKSDRDRILERFPYARVISSKLKDAELTELQRAWDAGEVRMLLGHPAAMGHGLNLQLGGHIVVWFGLTWPLRLYRQTIGRLHRSGQKWPVIVHQILARNTADEVQLAALESKFEEQGDLRRAISDYRRRRSI